MGGLKALRLNGGSAEWSPKEAIRTGDFDPACFRSEMTRSPESLRSDERPFHRVFAKLGYVKWLTVM